MRPLFDSKYIFGIHEPGGEQHMLAAGRPGWVLFNVAIGSDPNDRSGVDFRPFSDLGLGVICRINHGYEPHGTIPHSSFYEQFARRVANFVSTSPGCKTWVLGNEMNYAVERPGIQIDWSRHARGRPDVPEEADPFHHGLPVRFNVLPDYSDEIRTTRAAIVSQGEVITPDLYTRCYRYCRDAVHYLPGHDDDQVLVGAVAPWNTQTIYHGNPNGDWIQYFREILEQLGANNCDGFALHTYTHGPDPALIASDLMLQPPFQARHQEFRAYRDFMDAVPADMRHLPAYITETDQSGPWADQSSGWVQRAYAEIDSWNRQPDDPRATPNQQIRALCLHRWPRFDKFYIDGKQGVTLDFIQALENDYRWQGSGDDLMERVDPAVSSEPTIPAPTLPPPTSPDPVPAAPVEPEPPVDSEAEAVEAPQSAYDLDATGLQEAESLSASDIRARRREEQERAQPYQIEWVDDQFPERLSVGQVIDVVLTIRNTGSLTWSWGGTHPFRIGYHYFRSRRILPMQREQDLRSDIPNDVAPGETVTVNARIALPNEPGNFTIEIDLVHEGVTWFKEQGAQVLSRWLTVEAPESVQQVGADGLDAEGGGLPVPLFTDLSYSLPRGEGNYARRNPDQVEYIVISHTAADPMIGLELIAQAHVQSGYPGIAYHYVVDSSGQAFKTSAMEDVAQPEQLWSSHGVNVCLTGDFRTTPPPLMQLDGAARLCAWLTQNLTLSHDTIVGLGELTTTDSPGATFYGGPNWKQMLVRQVQLNQAALYSSNDSDRVQDLDAQVAQLKAKNEVLETASDEAHIEREKLRLLNEKLQQDIAQLQRDIDAQPQEIETGLRISTQVDQLPRIANRYVERTAADVEFIVINHTGVDAETPLHDIAEAHMPDWPGILYDFVIEPSGAVIQTQPLESVVDTEQPYLANAVNIAFAGNFDVEVPGDEQLYSGGQLITWLLGRFANVQIDNIQGISEFIEHTSPGQQWMKGIGWKEMLLASVRRASGILDPSAVENELRTQVDTLDQQLQAHAQSNNALLEQKLQLEADVQRLQGELTERDENMQSLRVPEPSMRSIVEQLPRHPTLQYETRATNQVSHIAIHHTATPANINPFRIAELHVNADPSRGKESWPGIGYHFFVYDDGRIEQTNPLETVSYHVYRHNAYTVGIAFAGSFMNGRIPTSAQLRSGAHLVAWLMQELKVPLARVWGHRDFPDNTTVCPGSEWNNGNHWRDLLFERVEQIQNGVGLKSVRHYLLFWQREHPGPMARQDFVNATNYIARFRPALGFNVSDAKNAEYVTIVGNESGISARDEQLLIKDGCKVERVAGRDEEETGRILSELAQLGRRFRDFDVDF